MWQRLLRAIRHFFAGCFAALVLIIAAKLLEFATQPVITNPEIILAVSLFVDMMLIVAAGVLMIFAVTAAASMRHP